MLEIHAIWIGGTLSPMAKQGLRNLKDKYPSESKTLWVRPRSTGTKEHATAEAAEYMRQYQEEAQAAGVRVKNVMDHLDEFTESMGVEYTKEDLARIISHEMSNKGEIAVKDLTSLMVLGSEGGLLLDLSMHATTDEEWRQVQRKVARAQSGESLPGADHERRRPRYQDRVQAMTAALTQPIDFDNVELKIPEINPGAIIERHIGAPRDNRRSPSVEGAGIKPAQFPHVDVFVMYAKKGTDGQRVMQAAARKHVSFYKDLVEQGKQEGNTDEAMKVTRRTQDGQARLDQVGLKSLLGRKGNPGDPTREKIIGESVVYAVVEGVYEIYGQQPAGKDPVGTGRGGVPWDTWDKIAMPVIALDRTTGVIPELGVTKEFHGSWRNQHVLSPYNLTRVKGEDLTQVQAAALGAERLGQGSVIPRLRKSQSLPTLPGGQADIAAAAQMVSSNNSGTVIGEDELDDLQDDSGLYSLVIDFPELDLGPDMGAQALGVGPQSEISAAAATLSPPDAEEVQAQALERAAVQSADVSTDNAHADIAAQARMRNVGTQPLDESGCLTQGAESPTASPAKQTVTSPMPPAAPLKRALTM